MQILLLFTIFISLLPFTSPKKANSGQEVDFFSLTLVDLINIGIQDGLCLSQELVEEKYQYYLYGARMKRSKQKLTAFNIEFELFYIHDETYVEFWARVDVDLAFWTAKIKGFGWHTSIDDLL